MLLSARYTFGENRDVSDDSPAFCESSEHAIAVLGAQSLICVDAPPFCRESWSRTSNKFWLVAIVASLSRDIAELCRIIPPLLLSPPHARPWKNSGLTLLRVAGLHRALLLDLVKNLADFWIPYSSLGHVTLEPGTIGLLGVVSSMAAILPMLDPSYVLTPA